MHSLQPAQEHVQEDPVYPNIKVLEDAGLLFAVWPPYLLSMPCLQSCTAARLRAA